MNLKGLLDVSLTEHPARNDAEFTMCNKKLGGSETCLCPDDL